MSIVVDRRGCEASHLYDGKVACDWDDDRLIAHELLCRRVDVVHDRTNSLFWVFLRKVIYQFYDRDIEDVLYIYIYREREKEQ